MLVRPCRSAFQAELKKKRPEKMSAGAAIIAEIQ
jgi:hypothetical protein